MANKEITVASPASSGAQINITGDVGVGSFAPAKVVKPTLFGKLLGIAKKAVANPLVQQAVTAAVLGKLNKVIKGK